MTSASTVDGGAASAAPPVPRHVPRHVGGTVPYPWPYDGQLAAGRLALVIAGGQHWWVPRTQGVAQALGALEQLAVAVRSYGGLVVHIEHTAPPHTRRTGYLPAAGSDDARLVLMPADSDLVVAATGQSGGYGGSLEPALRAAGRDRVLVAGLGMEGPVHSTMRDLNDQGYECLLVADACSTDDPTTAAAAVSSVTMSGGIFGAVGDTAAVIAILSTLEAMS